MPKMTIPNPNKSKETSLNKIAAKINKKIEIQIPYVNIFFLFIHFTLMTYINTITQFLNFTKF